RDKADAYRSAVLALPCESDEEAQTLLEAARYSSHYTTPAVMTALRNMALNPSTPQAAVQAASEFGEGTRLWDDPRSWWIGYAGMLRILRETPHATAREQVAYAVRNLRQGFGSRGEFRRPLPAGVILEMARRALDPQSGDP